MFINLTKQEFSVNPQRGTDFHFFLWAVIFISDHVTQFYILKNIYFPLLSQ